MICLYREASPKEIYSEGMYSQLDGQTLLLHSGVALLSGEEFAAVVGDSVVCALIIVLAENSSHSTFRGIRLEVEWSGEFTQALLQLLEGAVTCAAPDNFVWT